MPLTARPVSAAPVAARRCESTRNAEMRRVAQLPDRAVEDEVVDVDDGGEDQDARREVEAQQIAGDPWARDEQGDAAGQQRGRVRPRPPSGAGAGLRLASGEVARHPEVLSRVHDREHPRAVAGLRQLRAGRPFGDGRRDEPDELRREERERGDHRRQRHAQGHAAKREQAKQPEDAEEHDPRRIRQPGGQAEGDDQRIMRRSGVEHDEQEQIRREKRPVEGAPLAVGRRHAVAPREHHQEAEVLPGVVPRTPRHVEGEDPGDDRAPDVREQGDDR